MILNVCTSDDYVVVSDEYDMYNTMESDDVEYAIDIMYKLFIIMQHSTVQHTRHIASHRLPYQA